MPAPDPVHDMRVAARRLRASLRLLRLRQLDREVKKLQDALGEVRDLQLQIAWLEGRDRTLLRGRAALLGKAERALQSALREWHAKTLPRLLDEERDRWTGELRFDVLLLAQRLALATQFASEWPQTRSLRIGYFGASTGAAAALIAAAALPRLVGAVVSRGGRPDLASGALEQVQAPTLLIVGGEDRKVIELNRQAYARLRCEKGLEIIPGATHLFEEPGALEAVARLATAWFGHYLVEARQADSETNQEDIR